MADENRYVTGLTEGGLSKMVNPEAHFKYSNWEQWLEYERLKIEGQKVKQEHERFILKCAVLTMVIIIGSIIYFATSSLINKDVLSGFIGTITGAGLTIFIRFSPKTEQGQSK